jgi:hypothetical protein
VYFGLLQADNVRLVLFDNRRQLMGAGAQSVDIKRDKFHKSLPQSGECGRDVSRNRRRIPLPK